MWKKNEAARLLKAFPCGEGGPAGPNEGQVCHSDPFTGSRDKVFPHQSAGGGNFWRGRSSGKMDRMDADKIGMLATVMNALAVKDALRQQGVDAVVMTSSFMPQVAECFTSDKAIAALESGKIVVFGGGTGNPIFSTDTASALRALEIGADAMFKATMVDGVYDKDPHKYADAVRYDTLTFTRVLDERLAVMDSTAATLCRDNGLPILVFDLGQPANIAKAVKDESVGTLVRE